MANSPSTETAEAPAEKIIPLYRSAITFNESRNNVWSAVVPRNTSKERLLQSGLWSVVSDQFRPFDRVNVIYEDRSGYAELLVVDAGRGFCTMQLLHFYPLPALLTSTEGLPPGFSIDYRGPDQECQWCVTRLADNVMMVRGKPSRDAALAELLDSATLR
ncbi:hypothetical protein NVV94_12150 [Pseudomonas sp. LS1212]|uniref:hypothetical protein n=1 Tax=Pseudomonas sp. LS1212 TaxID=2972478 RepID=UPI00215BD029|nr:hypothetical protein [Pseudomonas sp. LS1212]UVJ46216.1 hypothetical protein NVV94_12150 [Pseudomonas sp. LS1212]